MAEVSYQVEDRVAVVRLESPDTSNAFTPSMRRELNLSFIRFRDDEDAWVAVVCGDGDEFCAGSLPQPNPSYSEERERGLLWAGGRVDTMKPIIAAVQGACAGEGLALALGCDLRIAETGASFRALLDQDGGFPNIAAAWLVNLIGLSAALDVLWTRELLNAESAIRMGIVNRLVRQGDEEAVSQESEGRLNIRPLAPAITTQEGTAFSGGMKLARELLQYAPVTRSFQKETAYRSIGVPFHYAQSLEVGPNPYASEDRIEGTRAFVENRRPVWHNR